LNSDFHASALLYVGVPYLLALLILAFRRDAPTTHWRQGYLRHVSTSLVVFLGSSVVLFEGFLCVLFFMPIYFFFVTLAFLGDAYHRRRERSRFESNLLTGLVCLLALEGTVPSLSFERASTVHVESISNLSVAEVRANLTRPVALPRATKGMLRVFPMPVVLDMPSLEVDAVHTAQTRYHRWFFGNTHEGRVRMRVIASGPTHVHLAVIEDSSYFASYLKAQALQLKFEPLKGGGTRVQLTIEYQRKLDPAWYFAPLIHQGVAEAGTFFLQEIALHEPELL
ncbi:MAG: hypothetical protein AAGA45_08070, partial [Verrucomicrobiota bacterium]